MNRRRGLSNILTRSVFACAGVSLCAAAQTNFGTVNISGSKTETVTVNFPAAATLKGIAVLTEGVGNEDFIDATGGACKTGKAYAKGAACTIDVTFKPRHPGTRYGAVVLAGSGSDVVATAYLQGTGMGPQTTFIPATWNAIGSFEGLPGVEDSGPAPAALAADTRGNLFVAAQSGFDVNIGNYGAVIEEIREADGSYREDDFDIAGPWGTPTGIAIDGAGNLYITDQGLSSGTTLPVPPGIYKEIPSPNGEYHRIPIPGSWNAPQGIAVDGSGNLYIVDSHAVIKEKLQPDGSYSAETIASGFEIPESIAVDGSGNLFVADSYGHTVYKETLSNGKYKQTVVDAKLVWPFGLAVDISGNIYVSDDGNQFSGGKTGPALFKETLEKNGSYTRSVFSKADSLIEPEGLALDNESNLYLADFGNYPETGFAYLWQIDFADPPSLQFDPTPRGSTSADSPRTVLVADDGNAPLIFSDVSYPTDFPKRGNARTDCSPGTKLTAGESCTLVIDFSPDELLGSKTSREFSEDVEITTNNLNGKSDQQKISVSGLESKLTPMVSLGVSGDPLIVGSTVTFSVLVQGPGPFPSSPIPTGEIDFYSGKTKLVSRRLNFDGLASYSTSSLPVGVHSISAVYDGDPEFVAAGSQALDVVIDSAPPVAMPEGAGFGSVDVGKSSGAVDVRVKFNKDETLSGIAALTQGASGLDFEIAGGGTCETGKAYVAGASCTVKVRFAPKFAGTRAGALVLTGTSGSVIGTTFLAGTGVAPQTVFLAGTEIDAASGFNNLGVVAVDGDGNLYAFDNYDAAYSQAVLYKFPPSGGKYKKTKIAAGFTAPGGIALDGAGNIYVAALYGDEQIPSISKLTLSKGSYLRSFIGSGFGNPAGVAVDGGGNVYVADRGFSSSSFTIPSAIYKEALTPGGYVQNRIAGGFADLTGIAVDASGDVFVADAGNGGVYELKLSNGVYTKVKIAGGFVFAAGIAIDDVGNIYVADAGNVQTNKPGMVYEEVLSVDRYTQSVLSGQWIAPISVAVAGNGNLVVADTGGETLFLQDYADPPALSFATTALGALSSDSPQTVTVANHGNAALRFSAVGYPIDFPEGSGVATDCKSSTALASGRTCTLTVDFKPIEPLNGKTSLALRESVRVTTDTLNVAATTQRIAASGTESPPTD